MTMDPHARTQSAFHKIRAAEKLLEDGEAMLDADPVAAVRRCALGLMLAFEGIEGVLLSDMLSGEDRDAIAKKVNEFFAELRNEITEAQKREDQREAGGTEQ